MNQIALGYLAMKDDWLVLHGDAIQAPFKRANYQPQYEADDRVEESILLSLEGSPAELAAGLSDLQTIVQLGEQYEQVGYPAPACIRFQPEVEGGYFYAEVHDLSIEIIPQQPVTRRTASLMIRLHYSRQNHFDSDLIELPLFLKAGADILGGLSITNHTDFHPGHGSSVLVKASDVDTELPAPLRLELTNTDEDVLHDVYAGVYHHPVQSSHAPFFYYAGTFEGGTLFYPSDAVNTQSVRLSWASADWTDLGSWLLENETVRDLGGWSYRPIIRLYQQHDDPDLRLKIKLQAGSNILWEGESAYADPQHGYVLLPPVRIPPNRLLNETAPHHVDLVLYGKHDGDYQHTLDIDHLILLPLEPGAAFVSFYDLQPDATLIDDNFRRIQNARFSAIGSETVSHVRQGGLLTIWPGVYNRVIFVLTNALNQIDITRTASVRLFYRKRVRFL